LLGKVIETHIANSVTCEAASGALWNLFDEPNMNWQQSIFIIPQKIALLLMVVALLDCLRK